MQAVFGAPNLINFPTVAHLTLPVENFFATPELKPAALVTIANGVTQHNLEICDHVVMACNTAHLLADQIVSVTDINLTSIVQITKNEVVRQNITRLGIVASPVTFESGLYDIPGVTLIKPSTPEIRELEKIIRHIIGGGHQKQAGKVLGAIIRRLLDKGAESVLLGCSELELIMRNSRQLRLIRPLDLTIRHIMALDTMYENKE